MTIDISTNEIDTSTSVEERESYIELSSATDLSNNIVSPSAIINEYESFKDDIPNYSDDDLGSVDTVNSIYIDQMKRSLDEDAYTNRNLSAYNYKKSSNDDLISVMKKIKSSFSKEKEKEIIKK